MMKPFAAAIDSNALCDILQVAYQLRVTSLEFLPLGNDATAVVYHVCGLPDDDMGIKRNFFLKLKDGPPSEASLRVPAYLHDNGLPAVVAPLPTATGDFSYTWGQVTLVLYPFIRGETGMAKGLTLYEWTHFGQLMQRWHCYLLPSSLAEIIPRETFISPHLKRVAQLTERLIHHQPFSPLQQIAAQFWREKQDVIAAITQRLRVLSARLRATPPPFVLCHADIHTANLLVDAHGAFAVIDWDGLLWAPKERDLIFVTARAAWLQEEERAFCRGYGDLSKSAGHEDMRMVPIDPVAFAYYRYEWVVQELADYGSRIFLPSCLEGVVGSNATEHKSLDENNVQFVAEALTALQSLFQPGDVVAVAHATEADLDK